MPADNTLEALRKLEPGALSDEASEALDADSYESKKRSGRILKWVDSGRGALWGCLVCSVCGLMIWGAILLGMLMYDYVEFIRHREALLVATMGQIWQGALLIFAALGLQHLIKMANGTITAKE